MIGAADPSAKHLSYCDPKERMTLGRRFALFFANNGCYNPSSKLERDEEKKQQAPSLDKAWEYFEHHVLPRCLVADDKFHRGGGNYTRAEIGQSDKDTMLYPIWKTPIHDMADFGVGVALYFSTLRFLAIITFIAGCINIPLMVYFDSDVYVGSVSGIKRGLETFALRGSAVCVNTSFEVCPTCVKEDWETYPSTNDRLAWGTNGSGETVAFIKKNGCNVNDLFGILSLVTLVFIVGAVYYWIFSQKKRIDLYDEAEDSSTDYSIEITVS